MKDKKDFFAVFTGKKGSPILIGLLIGLLLLVVAWPDGSRKKTTEQDAVTVQGSRADTQQQSADQRAKALERRLENVLSQVQGVGNVTVMITLRTQGENVVEKDKRTSQNKSTQDADSSGKSSADASEQEENTVYEKRENGEELPYVKEVKEPEVAGVIVAAEGGENAQTAADITEAVMALFGIEAHKIKVMKKV